MLSLLTFLQKRSTTDQFRFIWKNYNENNLKVKRGKEHKQLLVSEHFSTSDQNGLLKDFSITLTQMELIS